MRHLVLLVLSFALVPTAFAAGARERLAAGPLSAVAIAGTDVSYTDRYRTGCHEIRLWDIADRSDRRLASHCFASTSTGSGVAAIASTGGRALWLTYTGGNIREWSLWTRGPRARAKRISFLTADVDGPPPVVLGRAWEGSLPFAVGRTVIVLAPNGSRKFTLSAPDRVVALSAHSRGYAAVLASGNVLTISPQGKALREFPFEAGFVEDAVLVAAGLVVKTPDGLEIRNGGSIREISLPRGSRFLGFSEGIVAYGTGRQLRLKRLTGGHDALFRTLAPGFQAQLGRRGIVYVSGRTLGFTVWAFVSGSV
jgi:outer membrane protein assembly factor BamB